MSALWPITAPQIGRACCRISHACSWDPQLRGRGHSLLPGLAPGLGVRVGFPRWGLKTSLTADSGAWGPHFRPHHRHRIKGPASCCLGRRRPPRPPAESVVEVRSGYRRPRPRTRGTGGAPQHPQADSPQPLPASDTACFSTLADALFSTPPGFGCAPRIGQRSRAAPGRAALH